MSTTDTLRLDAAPGRNRLQPATVLTLGVGFVAVVVVRMWTSRGRRIYGIWPDEPAQLAMARLVGGGGAHWNMNNHSTWRPGYATLLGAVYRFTDDPTTVFRSALAINAVLGGVTFVLLYVLARRFTVLSVLLSGLAAVLVSLAPSMVFTTTYVWSEGLAQPLYLGALLALLAFNERPAPVLGAAAGLLSAAAFATHSRMLPLSFIVVAVTAVNVARHRLGRRGALAVVAATAAGFVAVSSYSNWIVDTLWNEPSERNSYRAVARQASKLGDTTVSAIGQSWYLLATTAGLAGLGLVALVAAAWHPRGHPPSPEPRPERHDAVIVVVCSVTLALLSIVFMAGETRPDRIVYGRYNDAVFAPVTLLGLAALVTTPLRVVLGRLAAVAVVMGTLGAALSKLRADELAAGGVIKPMVLGLIPFVGQGRELDAASITVTALVVIAMVAVATAAARLSPRRSVALAAIAAVVAVAYARTDHVVGRGRNGIPSTASVAALDGTVLRDGEHVVYLLQSTSNDTGRMMNYQFFLPHHRFDIVDPDEFDPATSPSRIVVAKPDDAGLIAAGAEIAWQDPNGKLAFWVLPPPDPGQA